MDDQTREHLRALVQEDIDVITLRLERDLRIIRETHWGTQGKHARDVGQRLLEAETEVGYLLYELRDCLRDDEEVGYKGGQS